MTPEQKAKAYDEAIGKAAALYKASEPMSGCNVIIETLFPELKESEDEKIRKEIINYFKCQTRDEPSRKDIHNKWISWLERQGEHANFRNKIQVGDKVTRNEDGVLVNLSQLNRVAKKNEKQASYTTVETGNGGINALVTLPIEMKTAEESLGVDSKTYNKIVDECILGEQKPEDKIEDEEYNGEDYGIDSLYHAQRILEKTLGKVDGYQTDDGILSHKCAITAVKKLYEQKPAWSEEDEKIMNGLIDSLTRISLNTRTDSTSPNYTFYKEIDWLKSLRPQNHWKPSDEQMKYLRFYSEQNNYDGTILTSLYNDLKKLKEE